MDKRIDAYLAEEVGLKIDQKASEHDVRLGSFMAKAGRMFPLRTNFPRRNDKSEMCCCQQQNVSANGAKKGKLRRAQSEEIKNFSKGTFFCSGCHKKLEVRRVSKISTPVGLKGHERSPDAVNEDFDDDVFAVSEEDEEVEEAPSKSSPEEGVASDRENTVAHNNGNNNVGEKEVNGVSEKLSKMAAHGFVDPQDEGQSANPVSMGRFGALSQTKESKYNGVVNTTHFHAATTQDDNQSDAN